MNRTADCQGSSARVLCGRAVLPCPVRCSPLSRRLQNGTLRSWRPCLLSVGTAGEFWDASAIVPLLVAEESNSATALDIAWSRRTTSDTHSAQIGRLEVVEMGRRRRWSEDEKLKIVLESLQAPRQVSATARRYGASRSLLLKWRRLFRAEHKDASGRQIGFVPATPSWRYQRQ